MEPPLRVLLRPSCGMEEEKLLLHATGWTEEVDIPHNPMAWRRRLLLHATGWTEEASSVHPEEDGMEEEPPPPSSSSAPSTSMDSVITINDH